MKYKNILYGAFIVLFLAETIQAAEVFSDDFNDNIFDTNKWTTDINDHPWWGQGYGLGIWETNQELKCGIDSGWTYALSKNPVNVGNTWTEITYTGQMKFIPTGTGVATIAIRKGNSTTQQLSFQYNDWEDNLKVFENDVVKASIPKPTMPTQYFNFKLVIRKGGYTYYENNNPVFNITSTLFDDATTVTPVIGGWDGSHGPTEYAYYDNIKIETTEPPITAPENPETLIAATLATLLLCSTLIRK